MNSPRFIPAKDKYRALAAAVVLVISTGTLTPASRADIYRWDNNQLIPGTTGITPGPSIDLSNWNTPGHVLQFANFSAINLNFANFNNSDLTSAAFTGSASFYSANFTGAIITGANFDYTGPNSYGSLSNTQILSTASYAAKNLTGVHFGTQDLDHMDFTSQNLTSSGFYQANLNAANFTGANLTSAYLDNADLSNSTLAGANLTDAIINGSTFSGAVAHGFTAAQLYSTASYKSKSLVNVRFGNASNYGINDCSGWDFSSQVLDGAQFMYVNITNANFTGATIRKAYLPSSIGFSASQLYSTADYQAKNLSGMNLYNMNFSGFDLTSQNLSSADLTIANLSSATLANANLTDAKISGTNFSNTTAHGFTAQQFYSTYEYKNGLSFSDNFSNNDLSGWNFAGKSIGRADSSNFTSAALSSTSFHSASLISSNFTSANATAANFQEANLTSANFTNTNLTGATFSPTTGYTTPANLTNAMFTNANITAAKFEYATNNGFTSAQLYSTANYLSGNLSSIDFAFSNLTGWSFAGKNLTSASLYVDNLTNADFTNANLASANLTYANFTGANLSGATFTNATILGANFTGAISHGLTPAQFYATANYISKNLGPMTLANNDLTGWNFTNQTFTNGADFSNCVLTSLNLSNTDLDNATFTSASLNSASFNNANLSYAHFTAADGRSANFTSANLSYASFTGADFRNANFASANLTNTSFALADLRNATNFSPAASTTLRGLILPNATVQAFTLNSNETFHIRAGNPVTLTGAIAYAFNSFNISIQIDAGAAATSSVALSVPKDTLQVNGTLTTPALSLTQSTLSFTLTSPSANAPISITNSNGLTLNGATLQLTDTNAPVGYYKLIQYAGTIQGTGLSSLTLPATQNGISYFLDTTHDPGFIDLHRGFLGDTNDSGTVDLTDLTTLAANWQQSGTWSTGDFNGDGIVDLTDLTILASNWQSSPSQFQSVLASFSLPTTPISVPEPATLALMGISTAALLIRRRAGS